MVPATMTSLRNLKLTPQVSAAILPDFELAFDIPGARWIEPSAASVRYQPGSFVHGVLYEGMSESDFFALGRSEGVPWSYRWLQCRVIKYSGDGNDAGRKALKASGSQSVEARVLTKSNLLQGFRLTSSPGKTFIPPSRSYLKLLQEGANFWRMDRAYQDELSKIQVDPIVPGFSSELLEITKRLNPQQ